jgi:nitrite reductase/ring-hydroxylating ferredoxin subunit
MAKKKAKKKTTTKEAKQIAQEVADAIDGMIVNFNTRKKIQVTNNVCGHTECPLCDWLKKRG